jgi:REP element-mobilizing transposase RayT
VGEREFWIVGLLPRAIITRMSRLRRLVLFDRWFFISCRVLPRRRHLSDAEFATLAQVIAERRAEHRFLLTAWVFLPDHGHALFYPRRPLTISRVKEAIRDGATKRINHSRRETGTLWQPRFPSTRSGQALIVLCAPWRNTTQRRSISIGIR